MYYNMAKAPSACSHSLGGSVCFHSFGGCVRFHSFGGCVSFHSFGGSAGGRESGLSPSSHPASSAARRTCLLRLSIAPDSSACLYPPHPPVFFYPPTHLPALTRLHPSACFPPPLEPASQAFFGIRLPLKTENGWYVSAYRSMKT